MAGADPVGEHRRPQPPSAAAGAHPLRSPRPESWSCREAGVPATPSRWRSRVQVPSGPPEPYSSAAERVHDRHEVPGQHGVRLPSVCSSTDRASDYGSEGWGFESLQTRAPPGAQGFIAQWHERPAHTRKVDGSIPSEPTVDLAQWQSNGSWSQGYEFEPRDSPHGRLRERPKRAVCNTVTFGFPRFESWTCHHASMV